MKALSLAWPGLAPAGRSFAEVADDHLDGVHQYLLLLTADQTLAEDLAAETFEKALRIWRRYDPKRASERTWLCRIARSIALDHFRADARRRTREERFAHEGAWQEDDHIPGTFSPELDSALRSLTAAEREVIALRVVLDFEADAAAQVLGIGRSACSMRLARALRKLEERMEAYVVA